MTRPRPSATGEAGVSLVELLVVLAILALAALAAPALLSSARPGLATRAAVHELAHQLKAARAAAIESNQVQEISFDVLYRAYTTPQGRRIALPDGASWRIADAADAPVNHPSHAVSFYPDGSSSGGTVEIAFRGRRFRVVDHWLSGRISLYDGD